MVVVGLDRRRAATELARLAPAEGTEDGAVRRARDLDLASSGVADAIAAALETGSESRSDP
jgi:hypothetical protein